MDEKILTDADLKALEPGAKKYVQLEKADGKKVSISAHRILRVQGGAGSSGPTQRFSLQLANRSGKPTQAFFNGDTAGLFEQFNTLGVRSSFLAFREIGNPLAHMAEGDRQDSAIRISLINQISRPPGYRTSHGYKVRSVIMRLDGEPLRAAEDVAELAGRITAQGFKAAPGSGIAVFMLHPDQPALLNEQGVRLAPPKPPRRQPKSSQKSLI